MNGIGKRVISLASVVLVGVALIGTTPASADPPYSSGSPFDGNPISHGLGPTYGEAWCANAAPGTSIANQQGAPLALIPYEAIGCTLAQFQTEAQTAGVPPRMSYEVIGQSAGGRNIYGVVVNALETPEQQQAFQHWQTIREMELTDPAGAQDLLASYGDDIKIPIYVENNIHGDEEEGADAMMQTLRDLTTTPRGVNPYVDELLDHAILVTVPTINPDGRFLGQRANANNFDMNRDWLVQSQSEVKAERAFIQEWIPPVGLATHGYVNPTLIDGLTKPHNPGIEYDLFGYWNERRLDANQVALAGITGAPLGITRPRGANGLTGFTAYCSAANGVTTTCGASTNRTITSASESGTTVTITTTTNLGIDHTPGAQVQISGVANAAYNGTWTITSVPSANSYTFEHTQAGLAPSSGGTSAPKPGPANAEGWDDWGPFYTQTYLAFLGPDSSTLEMCSSGTNCNGRFGSKRAQYVGFWSSADFWVNHREDLIHDQLEIFRRGVEDEARVPCCDDPLLQNRGWLPLQQDWSVEYPTAYVIPVGDGQRSDSEANRLTQWLLDNGIFVERMTDDFTWNGTTYPAGSYVVSMAQALRGLAYTTLAAGQDVSQRITQLYAPPGAWSHGLLWGADTVEVPRGDASFAPDTEPITEVNDLEGGIAGGVGAPADFYSFTIRGTSDWHAVQDLLHDGVTAELAEEPFTSTTGGPAPAGTLLFEGDPATAAALEAEGDESGITFERSVGVAEPAAAQIQRAPRVGILVNSALGLCPAVQTGATATCSDTTQTLRRIFGSDVSLISTTTGTGSLQLSPTDPLANIDVLYNAGQAFPAVANATARARLNAFFQRGGGYIATSQSTTGFTFLTTSGNAFVGGSFTGASASAGGGIARWSNVGGAASPLTGPFPNEDFLYLPSNVTYFSATPTGASIDGRYLSNMADGANGPTAGFVAGLWRARSTATNNAPIAVHGMMQAPFVGRYFGLATNPFSRHDAEREWPMIAQAALWTNVTDEATSAITFPEEDTYGFDSWNDGCSTPAGDICGTGTAAYGPGFGSVKVAVRRVSTDTWWDGSSFSASSPNYVTASGTTSWSLSFPAGNIPANGDYEVRSKAVDAAGTEQVTPDSVTFTYQAFPTVTRSSGPATQSVQYSDPITAVGVSASDPDSSGSALTAQTSYVHTPPAGCGGPCATTSGLPAGLSLTGPTHNGATVPGSASWEVSGNVSAPAGSYAITVAVGDEEGATGSTTFTVDVGREDAQLIYNGSDLIEVGTQPTLSAQVLDSAAAGYSGSNAEPAGTLGDITKIWVRFDVSDCITSATIGVPKFAQVSDTGTLGDGIGRATASFPYSSSAEATWCVTEQIVAGSGGGTNQFYTAPMDQSGVIVHFKDSGQYASAGGTIPDGTSKANFGLIARYNKKGKPQGQFVVNFRTTYQGAPATVKIKSNSLTGLSFSGTTYPISATLAGAASITITNESGTVLFSEGGWRFRTTVTDKNVSPGAGNDSMAVTIWDKHNQLYRSVPTTPLSGGNVTVHAS